MIYRNALICGLAVVCGVSCGGEAKPSHSDRNDALNETEAQPSSTSATDDASESVANTQLQPSPTATGVNASQHTTASSSAGGSAANGSSVPTTTAGVTTVPDETEESATPQPQDAGPTLDSSDSTSSDDAGQACGARAGDTCAATAYCAYAPGQLCGRADAEATCKPRPESCTADYNPVCGCDGMTYGNSCTAAAAGVGVFEEGTCADSEPEPVDCENIQCLRAITCAESCTSEVVQAGCCPCPAGLIDTFTDCP